MVSGRQAEMAVLSEYSKGYQAAMKDIAELITNGAAEGSPDSVTLAAVTEWVRNNTVARD